MDLSMQFVESDRCTTHFLHLELDGGLDLVDLLGHGLGVSQETREFTGFVETRSQQSRDLLDERLRGEEGVVLLGELLDQLLVLVEFLQGFGIHEWDFECLGFVAMLLVAENAHLHLRAWDELQPVDGNAALARRISLDAVQRRTQRQCLDSPTTQHKSRFKKFRKNPQNCGTFLLSLVLRP